MHSLTSDMKASKRDLSKEKSGIGLVFLERLVEGLVGEGRQGPVFAERRGGVFEEEMSFEETGRIEFVAAE